MSLRCGIHYKKYFRVRHIWATKKKLFFLQFPILRSVSTYNLRLVQGWFPKNDSTSVHPNEHERHMMGNVGGQTVSSARIMSSAWIMSSDRIVSSAWIMSSARFVWQHKKMKIVRIQCAIAQKNRIDSVCINLARKWKNIEIWMYG